MFSFEGHGGGVADVGEPVAGLVGSADALVCVLDGKGDGAEAVPGRGGVPPVGLAVGAADVAGLAEQDAREMLIDGAPGQDGADMVAEVVAADAELVLFVGSARVCFTVRADEQGLGRAVCEADVAEVRGRPGGGHDPGGGGDALIGFGSGPELAVLVPSPRPCAGIGHGETVVAY